MSRTSCVRFIPPVLIAALCGCQPQLMPTPNIYASGEYELFRDLAPELKTSSVDVLCVTDRTPIARDNGTIRYGYGRSKSVAWGRCVVEFGKEVGEPVELVVNGFVFLVPLAHKPFLGLI